VSAELVLPWALLGLRFGVDRVTAVLLGLALVVWALAALHAWGYLARDPRRGQFMAFFAATFAGNLGLLLARDGAGFYLFFAVMTFAAYGLVVHTREPEALRAGRVYIVLAVLGEASLLAGLLLAAGGAASLALEDLRAAVAASGSRDLIVALLLAGFGVKAGALGVHMWLPLAHPAAPTPASAVLSGVMIKAGLLGWLHFLPIGEGAFPAWGLAIAIAGIAAALLAALVGVMQDDPKSVLAYSSVAQMGFMTVAVGAALASPEAAPGAVAAAVVHALHHGLAKGALFLGVGVSPRGRRGAHLAIMLLPALVLAGMPLTSGALAKQALKHALDPLGWAHAASMLLAIAAVGTTVLLARFMVLMHAGAARHASPGRGPLAAWLACVAASIAAGWLPGIAAMGGVGRGSLADAWPIAAGVALAAMVAWRGGRLRRLRVPPGDVLTPVAAMATGSSRRARAMGASVAEIATGVFAVAQAQWHRFVEWLGHAWIGAEARLLAAGPPAALFLAALVFIAAA
jgi:formate hydrogenlyase subunit 3/multisubunit Na+/H+ antiporter MnhD subunit